MKAIIGTKIGMTQIYVDGAAQAVTLIQAAPGTVTRVKTDESDGYKAIVVGFGENKKLPKSVAGQTKAAKISPKMIKEFRTDNTEEVAVGDSFDVSAFEAGEDVTVSGISKGKGFAGTIKRWNFHRGPKTHGGQSYRRPGSIGSMYPQKIFKGKKMAGRMGKDKVTVKGLKVALVDQEKALIGIFGAVPGPRKSQVVVKGNS